MKIVVPELSLVVLIGPSGSGKSSFAAKHFRPSEVVSSDACRAMVADDPNDQAATKDAFELLRFIGSKRLQGRRLTVIDATNVQPEARKPLVALAKEHDCLPVAIVLNMPEAVCVARNRERPDRSFGSRVVHQQSDQLRRSLGSLKREGFRYIYVLNSPEEVDAGAVVREPLWTWRPEEHGPFDIIGDVHGCYEELLALLGRLGYNVAPSSDSAGTTRYLVTHPNGRKAVFVGDLVDRGPAVAQVLCLVRDMVQDGVALCVAGNHEARLLHKVQGRRVQETHGLAESLTQMGEQSDGFRRAVAAFLDSLISHYVLDDGKLAVSHAGVKAEYQGRASGRVRDFCLYGETTGETDEFGLPVRYNWAGDYRGQAIVVYGHTPVVEPAWLNHTINIDTGCVFGGKLTALRYPEKELVSVPAAVAYYQPVKPLGPNGESIPVAGDADTRAAHLLDIDDVLGKRIVSTRLRGNITVREENASAALEVMSRFAVDPRWLIYLPPTMSPPDTSRQEGILEHPAEVFSYYRNNGVSEVVCQEKHMGSRAIVIIGRTAQSVGRRFGIPSEQTGVCYTRSGRRFFEDSKLESEFLEAASSGVEAAGLWAEFGSDWLALDCELMPWSMKAQELLRDQYAAVGAASQVSMTQAIDVLRQAKESGVDVGETLSKLEERLKLTVRYVDAYRNYCWPVNSLADVKLAPFHVLASEGRVYSDRDHLWHMGMVSRLNQAAPSLFKATEHKVVKLDGAAGEADGIQWGGQMTGRGGEGMVVKPLQFIPSGKRGLLQPAMKCRGPEYLRIIYGPDYTLPENLERLRNRGLAAKRSLATREFALGLESLARFVEREPLYRVHECAFAVLALESEPIDPRL